MPVQTEEKLAVSPEMVSNTVDSPPEEMLDSGEGWRIAREALLREVVRYGGQGAVVLVLVGVVGYAGYWSLGEMRFLPAVLEKISKPFLPPPPVARSSESATAGAAKLSELKVLKAPVKKHHYRPKVQIAAKVAPKPTITCGDNPTGGHIIYQDGMITQYSWNK